MVTAITNTPAMNFALNYLQSNPEATEQQLQAALKNHLQELKKNGAKISKKQITQANAQIGELYKAASEQIKANLMPRVTPVAQEAIASINTSNAVSTYQDYQGHINPKAYHHYDNLISQSKKAKRGHLKKTRSDAKAAFGGDEYIEFLRKHHPDLYEEMQKEATQTPPAVISNNQNKREARQGDDAYISSKKRKQMKKEAEIASQTEHKKRVLRNNPKDKKIRKARANAHYCTSQGIMTKKAKNVFNSVERQLDGELNIRINEEPNRVLKAMKKFYSDLEAKAVSEHKPSVSTPVSSSSTVTTEVSNVVDAAKNSAKNLKSSKVSGGKIGLIVAGVVGLASALGFMLSGSDSKEEKKDFNEAA